MPPQARAGSRKAPPFQKVALKAVGRQKRLLSAAAVDFFDHQLWDHAATNQLGVIAWDPDGHKCGLNVCTSSLLKNYLPFDRYKQTIVGKMLDYGFYDDRFGDEADWNIHVDPDPPFRYLLDDVVQVMTPGEISQLQRRGGRPVVECEITPDEKFYNNQWFTKEEHVSPNIGKKLGLYGPWVRDGGHGGRPEIHPCEIIWWRDPPTATTAAKWVLLVVQDDSNRFDRKSDFSGRIQRAWSQPPRRAAFAVALDLRDGYEYEYRLTVGRHRNMAVPAGRTVTTTNSQDYELARSFPESEIVVGHGVHGGIALPTAKVRIEKKISRPRDLGPNDVQGPTLIDGATIPPFPDTKSPGMLNAQLSKIVRDPANRDKLRCFLNFDVQVGTLNDRSGEGYAEIFLEEIARTQLNVLAARTRISNRVSNRPTM